MADSPDFLPTLKATLKALNRLAHRTTNSPEERAQFFAAKVALINAMAAAGAEFSVELQNPQIIFLYSDDLGVRFHMPVRLAKQGVLRRLNAQTI
jgi:hypothetical protein